MLVWRKNICQFRKIISSEFNSSFEIYFPGVIKYNHLVQLSNPGSPLVCSSNTCFTPLLRRSFFKHSKRCAYLTFIYFSNSLIFDKVSSIFIALLRRKFSYDLLDRAEFHFIGEWFFSIIALKENLLKENAFIMYLMKEKPPQ